MRKVLSSRSLGPRVTVRIEGAFRAARQRNQVVLGGLHEVRHDASSFDQERSDANAGGVQLQ